MLQIGIGALSVRLGIAADQAVTGTAAHPSNGTCFHGVELDPSASVIVYDNATEVWRAGPAGADGADRQPTSGGINMAGPLKVTVAGGSATIYFGYK